jgi:5'-3' exonuclease
MWGWLDKFKPSGVCMFWDSKKENLWRKKLLTDYKVRNENEYFEDIRDDLIFTQAAARAIFEHMGVWQFFKDGMEADDLIYSACRVLSPRPLMIISTDADYEQIIFRMQNVRLWNPMADSGRGKFIGVPDHDPALAKALAGDKSDKIAGYRNIGPVKSAKLARDLIERENFLKEHDRTIFIRNLLLIDLALNPGLLKNDLYIQRVLANKSEFNKEQIVAMAKKHKVSGLIGEYDRIIMPFKLVLERAKEAV